MAQFHLHANASPGASPAIPYLLDLQSPFLSGLATRLVAPVYHHAAMAGAIPKHLGVELDFDGQRYVAMVPEMAALPARYLGPDQQSFTALREQFVGAIDLLVSGM